jgi:hypothetical protein
LKEHIEKHIWTPTTQDAFTLETVNLLFEASPRTCSSYILYHNLPEMIFSFGSFMESRLGK